MEKENKILTIIHKVILTDIVRIRNGEVCYWPNLGYGRFGVKVSMLHAPYFQAADKYHPQYLSLADIRGTGTSDFGNEDNWNDATWKTNHKGDGNAVQNYTQKYSYDEVGNILQLQHIAGAGSYTRIYEIDSNSNKLLSTSVESITYSYDYDARGNMTAMPHLSAMNWNTQNELKSIMRGSKPTYYQYSNGERVRKFTDKGIIKEERIYLGNFEIYRKFEGGSLKIERQTVHVNDDIGRIAMLEKRTFGSAVDDIDTAESLERYVYSNHLQSASLELDKNTEIISYEEYHPYGTTSYQANNSDIKAVAKRYRYTGKERDEESGLYYHGARYYVPWLARWTAVDALQNEMPTWSPYNYCFNNPINLTDPDGRWPNPPFGFRLGFNLGLGSKGVNFNVTVSTGVEHRTPNFQAVAFASASVYGGQQLGTSSMTRGLQFDVTAGAYASVGTGTGSAHNFYTLNFNTASPFNNTFNTSFTYGQARTFNSAINAIGDGPGWQTQGIVGARFGENFSLSSNNDANSYGTGFTNRLLGDNNTDAGWTGGIVLNIGGVEAGYQNFSGYWAEFPSLRYNDGHYTAENRNAGNGAYHQSLNKAFNFVRKGNFSGGVFSGAWLQNFIHKNISDDGTYIYNNQGNINTTVGQ